jgi:hypothetical protein
MSNARTKSLTVREYTRQHGITLQTAYRRVWDGRVNVRRVYGRWLSSPQLERNRLTDKNVQGREAALGQGKSKRHSEALPSTISVSEPKNVARGKDIL